MSTQFENSHLHSLPVPCQIVDGAVYVEEQAANGIRQWSEHFDPMVFAMPQVPEQHVNPVFRWVPFAGLELGDRVRIQPLPWGYGPAGHLKHCREVASLFRRLIPEHRYLQFGIGGCTFGDWSALGSRLAKRMGRSYAVHTDWVTHRMTIPSDIRGLRRMKRLVERKVMFYAERQVIKNASLGLFHGADTYEAYREWCPNAQLIHDVHIKPDQLPSADDVARKANRSREEHQLNIIYAGRAAEMKGPMYWLEALSKVHALQNDFHACWHGDGPELHAMRQYVSDHGLEQCVELAGMAAHSEIIEQLRAADILMFCHLTPESPRILVESLNQATPIVGFMSPYPADLTKGGGGVLVERGDTDALAKEIAGIAQNRQRLCELIREAAEAGSSLTDEAVFKHRADLIKEHLG